MYMNIVIIGSGNVAAVLGRKFKAARHNILQVMSRNASDASALAYELDTESTNYISMVNKNADVYIIAVADDAIDDVAAELKLRGKVVAHTAASVPKEVLKNVTDHYGVFYPLQTLRKEMTGLPDIPIFVDGSDEKAKTTLATLARSIGNVEVELSGDDERIRLHLAAVVVSNFSNYLYTLAEDYCRKEKIDFRLLLPLILETAQRLEKVSPKSVQTGPAFRHDQETVQKHIQILKNHPELKKVYEFLSERISGERET